MGGGGERGAGFFLLFLSRQSVCDSGTHREAGAGPGGLAEPGRM